MTLSLQTGLYSAQEHLDTFLSHHTDFNRELERASETILTKDFALTIASTFAIGFIANPIGGAAGRGVLRAISPFFCGTPLKTLESLALRQFFRMSAAELGVRLAAGSASFFTNALVFNAFEGHIATRNVARTAFDLGTCHFLNLFITPKLAALASPVARIGLQFLVGGGVFNTVSLGRAAAERAFGSLEDNPQGLLSQVLINYAMHGGNMFGDHAQREVGSACTNIMESLKSHESHASPALAVAGGIGVNANEHLLFTEGTVREERFVIKELEALVAQREKFNESRTIEPNQEISNYIFMANEEICRFNRLNTPEAERNLIASELKLGLTDILDKHVKGYRGFPEQQAETISSYRQLLELLVEPYELSGGFEQNLSDILPAHAEMWTRELDFLNTKATHHSSGPRKANPEMFKAIGRNTDAIAEIGIRSLQLDHSPDLAERWGNIADKAIPSYFDHLSNLCLYIALAERIPMPAVTSRVTHWLGKELQYGINSRFDIHMLADRKVDLPTSADRGIRAQLLTDLALKVADHDPILIEVFDNLFRRNNGHDSQPGNDSDLYINPHFLELIGAKLSPKIVSNLQDSYQQNPSRLIDPIDLIQQRQLQFYIRTMRDIRRRLADRSLLQDRFNKIREEVNEVLALIFR